MNLNQNEIDSKIRILEKKTNNNSIEVLLNSLLDDCKDYLFNNGGEYQINVINEIVNLKNKSIDLINNKSSSLNIHEYETFMDMIILITVNYFNAILDKDNDIDKETAKTILINTYNVYKKKGIVKLVIGDNNIEEFENKIKEFTNVDVSTDVKFLNKESFLITALSKKKYITIGDIYYLRKTMLYSFKNKNNNKFFKFYYENFKPLVEMLNKNNKLITFIPDIKECIKLSKDNELQKSFDKYVETCKKIYFVCKDLGMDMNEFDNKFKNIDGYLDKLPEPNTLFINKAFYKSIIHSI